MTATECAENLKRQARERLKRYLEFGEKEKQRSAVSYVDRFFIPQGTSTVQVFLAWESDFKHLPAFKSKVERLSN